MTKLYCILAREAATAIIFRRGPSRRVRLIRWNLKTDTFEPGQWFKGQVYVRKSDLTPDGTKLVYTAAKHRGTLPIWTAVSTAPFFTAHVLRLSNLASAAHRYPQRRAITFACC
jgi:hypothetical protein